MSKPRRHYILKADDGSRIMIDNNELRTYFEPRYAMTVHKSQGRSINGRIVIHGSLRMSAEMKYVAFTRAVSRDNVSVVIG